MLTINGLPKRNCAGISRRDLLQIGGAGLFGLSLPDLFAVQSAGNPVSAFKGGRAKSVIFLFLFGGPSQLETFDMKPEAPRELRGPFVPIRSRTPGLVMCEHLPKLADMSNKFGVIRTLSHSYNDHSGAGHYIQTGKRWHLPVGGGFSATPEDWPSMGAVVEYLSQKAPGGLERDSASYAEVPNWLGRLQDVGQYRRPGQYAGWLGDGFNPLTTRVDKREKTDNPYWRACTDEELTFKIEGFEPTLPLSRLRERDALLRQFEGVRTRLDAGAADALDVHRKRALALLSSDKMASALNVRNEPDPMRDCTGATFSANRV